jgi:hypothetical protein
MQGSLVLILTVFPLPIIYVRLSEYFGSKWPIKL